MHSKNKKIIAVQGISFLKSGCLTQKVSLSKYHVFYLGKPTLVFFFGVQGIPP